MNARGRLCAALAVFSAALALATQAQAYCLARTCDPTKTACSRQDDCIISGNVLRWPSGCVGFAVQEDGSRSQAIAALSVTELTQRGFDAWMNVDCPGGGNPSIVAEYLGMAECARAEFSQSTKNGNIVMLRDDWPYPTGQGVLGLTTVRFGASSGQIQDADIEVNADEYRLSVGDPVQGVDLESVLTHEIGHFLGLSHTNVSQASMFARYSPQQSSARSLEADDIAAICELYPPERNATGSCDPTRKFSGECVADQPQGDSDEDAGGGCQFATQASGSAGAWLLSGLLAGGWARRRQRSRAARG